MYLVVNLVFIKERNFYYRCLHYLNLYNFNHCLPKHWRGIHSEYEFFHIVAVNIIILTFYLHFMLSQLVYFIRAESERLGQLVEFDEALLSKVGRVEAEVRDDTLWILECGQNVGSLLI